MRLEDIGIGDRLRFRTWEDMRAEFGEEDGEIQCEFIFVREMAPLCGMSVRVCNIDDHRIYVQDDEGREVNEVLGYRANYFKFSAYMFEPLPFIEDPDPFTNSELDDLLGCSG